MLKETFVFAVIAVVCATQSTPLAFATESGTIEQKLDHNGDDGRVFSQRYFFDDQFADGPGSPVFFYVCGEDGCSSGRLKGLMGEAAQKFHGYEVALEHRYFGRSIPFPALTTENLKYLTVNNAIEDAAQFIVSLKNKKGLSGPWIAMGGSYAGDLSALLRQKHPELVIGALASSAPVMSMSSFTRYDESLARVAGRSCSEKVVAVTQEVERILQDSQKATAIKAQFGAQDLANDGDVLYWLADIAANAIQYGYKEQFCSLILEGDDPLKGYAQMAQWMQNNWNITALSSEVQGAMATDPESSPGRAWYYMECTEFANWQDANPGRAQSLRSSKINSDYDEQTCQRLFGIKAVNDSSVWNSRYYLPLLDPKTSNIFFTNGSDDPWSAAGISRENGNNANPNTETYTIEGASHMADLQASASQDSESLKIARVRFMKLVAHWLEQYGNQAALRQ
jgi:pimeloyl-ACP methyl ester carboxylesterase